MSIWSCFHGSKYKQTCNSRCFHFNVLIVEVHWHISCSIHKPFSCLTNYRLLFLYSNFLHWLPGYMPVGWHGRRSYHHQMTILLHTLVDYIIIVGPIQCLCKFLKEWCWQIVSVCRLPRYYSWSARHYRIHNIRARQTVLTPRWRKHQDGEGLVILLVNSPRNYY